jgi:hypothetical protein
MKMANLIRFDWLPESVAISPVGILFTGEIPYEAWSQLMAALSQLEGAAQWAIGDALNYGEAKYGEKYSQAMEVTGLSYQALANYSWVAKNVPVENRRQGLSWTHHRVVAKLSAAEQHKVLEQAEAGGWGAEVLADMVNADSEKPPEKMIQSVEVPPGISPGEAKHLLEAAVCNRRNGLELCPLCPYKGEK